MRAGLGWGAEQRELERRPLARIGAALAEVGDDRPTAVVAWGETPSGSVRWYTCPHPAGPPICWCRPPLPGLALLFAREHGVDLGASEVIGGGPVFRAMASAVGARWRG